MKQIETKHELYLKECEINERISERILFFMLWTGFWIICAYIELINK